MYAVTSFLPQKGNFATARFFFFFFFFRGIQRRVPYPTSTILPKLLLILNTLNQLYHMFFRFLSCIRRLRGVQGNEKHKK